MADAEFAQRIRERYPEGLTGLFAIGATRRTFILDRNRHRENPGHIADFRFRARNPGLDDLADFVGGKHVQAVNTLISPSMSTSCGPRKRAILWPDESRRSSPALRVFNGSRPRGSAIRLHRPDSTGRRFQRQQGRGRDSRARRARLSRPGESGEQPSAHPDEARDSRVPRPFPRKPHLPGRKTVPSPGLAHRAQDLRRPVCDPRSDNAYGKNELEQRRPHRQAEISGM